MKKGIAALVALVLLAGLGYGGWTYYNNRQIETMREVGVENLMASVNPDDYREAERSTINELLSKTEVKIRNSENESEVDALIKEVSTEVSELKTDEQYKKEEAEEERKRQEELERKRQEEEAARIAAEEEAARQAAAAAAQKKSSKKSSSGGGNGCVGGGSDAFY